MTPDGQANRHPAGRSPPREIADDLSSAGFVDARVSGRGGFGVVYRCRQPALDRDVAVKVLRVGRDDTDRVRFLQEQQAMGRLSGHPNIVHVLEAGVTRTGHPYIVMPFHARGRSTGTSAATRRAVTSPCS
ncbi:protein kinase domain-containing protein [Gordonia paraffinivorans]|uniref:protein kinase domain-containing protein n=1 Tax=Gordonia paraffinivorans TaxID=175628 RepID=UPI00215A70A9|nr:protein kinase [Gordonia paraffinivorans]